MSLGSGSIAFVAFNADGIDNLAFVAIDAIAVGTVITFTDNVWDGTGFATSESVWTWTATADVAAGTVITIDGLASGETLSGSLGTVAFTNETARGLEDQNESVYAYVGEATSPTFLAAITNDTFANAGGTLDGTGLVLGTHAIALATKDADADIAQYNTSRIGAVEMRNYLPLINNPANWITQDTAFDDSTDSASPNAPFSTVPFVEGGPGNEAANVFGDDDDSLTNTGAIVGGVSMGGGDDELVNSGSIEATGGSAVDMGDGDDLVTLEEGSSVVGTILLGAGDDLLDGAASIGDIVVEGGANDDRILAGSGDDVLSGGDGADHIDAGEGDDQLFGDAGEDVLLGGAGDDILDGGADADVLSGGDGDDTLYAGAGDTVDGDEGNDLIEVAAGEDSPAAIDGGEGDDTLELLGSGTGSLATSTVANVETLQVAGGEWAVGDTTGYTDIAVQDGATVTDIITLTGGQTLVVEEGGAVGNDGTGRHVQTTGGTVDNAGVINGLSYVGGSTPGTFSVVNQKTGEIDYLLAVTGKLEQDVAAIVNYGSMYGSTQGAIAIDFEQATGSGARIVNEAGGVIATASHQDVIRGGQGNVIENHGTIRSDADWVTGDGEVIGGGDAIDFKKKSGGTVHNFAGGWIEGSRHAVTGKYGTTIINEEDGTLVGRNGSAVNIDNDKTVANTVFVTNRGVMEGRSAGYEDSDGDAIDIDGLAEIENYGTIEGLGANGYHNGYDAMDANISEGLAIGGGTIVNHEGATIYGYGRAIQVDDSSNGAAIASTTITNDGTIEGGGNGPSGVSAEHAAIMQAVIDGAEAINIVGTRADTITNGATGAIIGGVSTDGGDDTLSNDGTMTAIAGSAVDLGEGDDLLINRGTITGAVLTGAGNDEIITTSTGVFDGAVSTGDGDDKLGNSGKITGTVDMGDGNDVVNLYIGTDVAGTILLGAGDDRLTADMYQSQGFTVEAGEGDDQVTTSFGVDVIHGGAGADMIHASDGDDQLFGEDGDDFLSGEAGSDLIDGGDGDDTLNGGAGADTLKGGAGADTIQAGAGDTVDGGAGDDLIELTAGESAAAAIDGGEGDDTVRLVGEGLGALIAATNVEKLVVAGGSWTVAGNGGVYADIVIEDGATVRSALTLNNDDTLTIEAGGTLTKNVTLRPTGTGVVLDNAGTIAVTSYGQAVTVYAQEDEGTVTVSNREGGVISGADLGSAGVLSVDYGDELANVVIDNAGTIEALAEGRVVTAKDFNGASLVLNNLATGVIRGMGEEATVYGNFTAVNNAGRIEGGEEGFDYKTNTGVTFNNRSGGYIEGAHHAVTGERGVKVLNEAGATMVGLNGSAVNIDNDGSEEQRVYVTNYGTMEGRSAETADSDGDAIDVDGLVQVLNYGTIKGLGAEGYHKGEPNVSEAIAVGGGDIVNGEAGTIYGYGRAIQVDNSSNDAALGATTIVNDGLIEGAGNGPEGVLDSDLARFDLRGNEAINLVGDYEDFLGNNSKGRIIGGVSMGGGRDTLNNSGSIVAVGGSAIDMGNGNDQVNLYVGATVEGDILLGAGDDVISSTSAGAFTVYGGEGNDTISMYDTIFGGDDVLYGEAGDDVISGGLGKDEIDGGEGNDTINGGAGDDILNGGAGDDVLSGGAGADTIQAGAGDTVDGGEGDDLIVLSTEGGIPVSIAGGAGSDTVRLEGTGTGAFGGFDGLEAVALAGGDWTLTDEDAAVRVVFAEGAQTLRLDAALLSDGGFAGTIAGFGLEDVIGLEGIGGATSALLGAGNLLTVSGGTTVVTLQLDPDQDFSSMLFKLVSDGEGGVLLSYEPGPGAGDDEITGGNGDETLDGGAGDDVVKGGAGNDAVTGGTGDDTVDGGSGDDVVEGGAGTDTVRGGSGGDTARGGAGDDAIDGGSGDDLLFGDAGRDTIAGGSGDDTIAGGADDDVLSGGSGHDVFVFAAGFGHDRVTDFSLSGSSADVIAFADDLFADFAAVLGAADQVGRDVVITIDEATSLTLANVKLAALAADDFRFA
ncbi:calcium-binding protein [Prosthecomicrobium pneumaticum]|uniref:Ca2+-binding RTX toxin-like protein n=1 Tax=Prosthecomicrobium pneumaticum TaxID=81895 RepID=A0A7W9CT43_9HYPH|nr:calcium-binding protein [Prosthecomicrobium pneumaticum]MBB5751156.1 Ca2+-binding RTX toxin-like protein [Prosthecomicrobium pneumaticum]